MKHPLFLCILFMHFFYVSCAVIKPVDHALLNSKIVSEINYKKNSTHSVYVGEPIVKVKLYTVDVFSLKYLKASKDFKIDHINLSGKRNQIFEIIGTVDYLKKSHYIIALPSKLKGLLSSISSQRSHHIGYLVNKKGRAPGVILNLITRSYTKGTFLPKPQNITFRPTLNKKVNANSGYLNYEITYTGTDGISLFFTYQEFSLNDVKKPESSRELKYEKNKRVIRCKNTIVKVHEANNEKISYTIIEDGLHKLM